MQCIICRKYISENFIYVDVKTNETIAYCAYCDKDFVLKDKPKE
jgi:hypothetical protein